MRFKRIACLINPAAGMDFPILNHLNRFFSQHHLEWEVFVSTKPGESATIAASLSRRNFDCIVTYGGDGTIMEVVRSLDGFSTPLLFLAGGTANVVVKELGIPEDPRRALELLTETATVRKLDTMICNGERYFIRINSGFFAKIVSQTTRESKDVWGSLAYAQTALTMPIDAQKYEISLARRHFVWEGMGLMVTNVGNLGIRGLTIDPNVDVTDGKLDLIRVKQTDIPSLLAVARDRLLQNHTPLLKSEPIERIKMKTMKPTEWVFDDQTVVTNEVTIEVEPNRLPVVTPRN